MNWRAKKVQNLGKKKEVLLAVEGLVAKVLISRFLSLVRTRLCPHQTWNTHLEDAHIWAAEPDSVHLPITMFIWKAFQERLSHIDFHLNSHTSTYRGIFIRCKIHIKKFMKNSTYLKWLLPTKIMWFYHTIH